MATFVPKRVALLLPWLIYGSHPPFIMRRPIKFYKIEEIGEMEDFRFGEGAYSLGWILSKEEGQLPRIPLLWISGNIILMFFIFNKFLGGKNNFHDSTL